MRILFFGDGPWATGSLERLIEAGYPVLGVVARSRPADQALLTLARAKGLAGFQPENVNSADFVREVIALEPDLNISVSYDQILRAPVRESAPLGFINFHAGKLPCYRGRNIINWAIINGEKEIGVTAHYVDAGIDTGDIILQKCLSLGIEDDYGTILQRVIGIIPDMVVQAVQLIESGRAVRQKQVHLPGSYFTARADGDEWLDWNNSSVQVYNKIRAITRPGPGARTHLNGELVKIWKARLIPDATAYSANPGQVVGVNPGKGVVVKTGDTSLLLKEAQIGEGDCFIPNWCIGTKLGVNLPAYLYHMEKRLAGLEEKVKQLVKPDDRNR